MTQAPEVTESEKQKFFSKCGISRSTRNVISYALFGISNIGMLSVGAMTGGTVPVGYVIGGTVLNGIAGFIKTSKNMDKVVEENKILKENVNKLIDTRASQGSNNTPNMNDDVLYPEGEPTPMVEYTAVPPTVSKAEYMAPDDPDE